MESNISFANTGVDDSPRGQIARAHHFPQLGSGQLPPAQGMGLLAPSGRPLLRYYSNCIVFNRKPKAQTSGRTRVHRIHC